LHGLCPALPGRQRAPLSLRFTVLSLEPSRSPLRVRSLPRRRVIE